MGELDSQGLLLRDQCSSRPHPPAHAATLGVGEGLLRGGRGIRASPGQNSGSSITQSFIGGISSLLAPHLRRGMPAQLPAIGQGPGRPFVPSPQGLIALSCQPDFPGQELE